MNSIKLIEEHNLRSVEEFVDWELLLKLQTCSRMKKKLNRKEEMR